MLMPTLLRALSNANVLFYCGKVRMTKALAYLMPTSLARAGAAIGAMRCHKLH